jgi:hypothetical protein
MSTHPKDEQREQLRKRLRAANYRGLGRDLVIQAANRMTPGINWSGDTKGRVLEIMDQAATGHRRVFDIPFESVKAFADALDDLVELDKEIKRERQRRACQILDQHKPSGGN